MALAFAEQRHQHVGAGDLVAAGGLDMDGGALHHPLEAGGRLGVARPVGGQACEVLVKELGQIRAQLVEVDAAGAQHGGRVRVVGQAQQEVLQRRVFMATLAGKRQGAVERLLKVPGQHGQRSSVRVVGRPAAPRPASCRCRVSAITIRGQAMVDVGAAREQSFFLD